MSNPHHLEPRSFIALSSLVLALLASACGGQADGTAGAEETAEAAAAEAAEAAVATSERLALAAVNVPPFQSFVEGGEYYAKDQNGRIFRLLKPSDYTPLTPGALPPELRSMTLQERVKDATFSRTYGFDTVRAARPPRTKQLDPSLLTPIRDQGDRGLCVAFAGTAALESAYRKEHAATTDVSEQYVWQVMNTTELWHPSPGTYPSDVDHDGNGLLDPFRVENNFSYFGNGYYGKYLYTLMNYSAPSEFSAPYLSGADLNGMLLSNKCFTSLDPRVDFLHDQWQSDRCDFAFDYIPYGARATAGHKALSGVLFDNASSKDPVNIERMIDADVPVAQAWALNWRYNPATDIHEDNGGTGAGLHAMLIVGYNLQNPDDMDDEEHNFFIVKNSWGGSNYLRLSYKFYIRNVLDGMVIDDVKATGTPSSYARWIGRWNMSINGERAALVIRRAAEKDSQMTRVGHLLFDGEYGRSVAVNGFFRNGGRKLTLRIPNEAGTADPFLRSPTEATGIELELALGQKNVAGFGQTDLANGRFVAVRDGIDPTPVFLTQHTVPAGLTPMVRATTASWVLPTASVRKVPAAAWVGSWDMFDESGLPSTLNITGVTASGSEYTVTGTLTTLGQSTAISGTIRSRFDKAGSFQYATLQVPTPGWFVPKKLLRLSLFSNGTLATPDMMNGDMECVSLSNYCPVFATRNALGYGWVWANNATSASYTPNSLYQFNSTGSTNTIKRPSTGVYSVTFPKLGQNALGGDGRGGHVQVTSYDAGAYCKVTGWGSSADGTVGVKCFGSNGVAKDARFVAFYNRNTFDGLTTSGATGAYVWSQATSYASTTAASALYSWNNAGKVNTITQTGTGRYTVALPGVTNRDASVHVTAYGSDSARCQVVGWSTSSSSFSANVACTTAAGAATDSRFTLSVGVGGLPASRAGAANQGAYAWADSPTSPSYTPVLGYQGNSLGGGDVTITRSGVGAYEVHMPRVQAMNNDTVMVTAYGSTPAQCVVSQWTRDLAETRATVRCYNAAGSAADSLYTFSYLTSTPVPL